MSVELAESYFIRQGSGIGIGWDSVQREIHVFSGTYQSIRQVDEAGGEDSIGIYGRLINRKQVWWSCDPKEILDFAKWLNKISDLIVSDMDQQKKGDTDG